MTRRRTLARHRDQLEELREIMNAMKALSYMELRRLAAERQNRQALAADVKTAAADFRHFYPRYFQSDDAAADAVAVYLVIGSERGFCANFNQLLLPLLPTGDTIKIVAIGAKLQGLLDSDPRVVARLEGARVARQVDAVLSALSDTLTALQTRYGVFSLTALYHDGGNGNRNDTDSSVVMDTLLPPFQQARGSAPPPGEFGSPPGLTLAPRRFFARLVEHYLFFALYDVFYGSLLRENEIRAAHLDAAVAHLERKSTELRQRISGLRQEEIIEEIEVILLNAGRCASDQSRG